MSRQPEVVGADATQQAIVEAARTAAPAGAVIVAAPSAQQLRALARITNAAQAQRASDRWNELRGAVTAIKTKYKRIRRPVEDAVASIKAEEQADLAPYTAAVTALGAAILDWTTAERERVKRENEARLRAAEEQAREDQRRQAEAIRAAAAQAPTAQDRRALTQQARQVEAAPAIPTAVVPAAPAPKLEGVGTRDYWGAEVHDEATLKAACVAGTVSMDALTPNQSWLDERADALHERMAIPGVTAVKRTGLVKGRR
jgi:hypothetical protein